MEQPDIFCNDCHNCSGFTAHYWKLTKCAHCSHSFYDHLWKKSKTTTPKPFLGVDNTSGIDPDEVSKVIMFNDEVHSFDDVHSQLNKAIGCEAKTASDLASQAHYAGGTCVFKGSYQECQRVANVLNEVNLRTCIQSYKINEENNPMGHKMAILVHEESDISFNIIMEKLRGALQCSFDEARYYLQTAANEGRVLIFWRSFGECLAIRDLLKPDLKIEIRDSSNSPLSLYSQCLWKVVRNLDDILNHNDKQPISHLPEDILTQILPIAFKSFKLNLPLFLKFINQVENLSVIDFGAISNLHADYLPNVDKEWLEALSVRYRSQLHRLILNHLHMNDTDLSFNFTNLSYISLKGCDQLRGLAYPFESVQNCLQVLDLTGTGINKRRIASLRETLPTTTIIIDQQAPLETESARDKFLADAFERVKDALPNDENIPEGLMEALLIREMNLMLAANLGIVNDDESDNSSSDSES